VRSIIIITQKRGILKLMPKPSQRHDCYTLYVRSLNAAITIAIRLRYDYDASRAPASIRRDSTPAKK